MTDLKLLFGFLDELSQADPKSLLERHVKTSEELGELARALLPYVGAAGAAHRFVTRAGVVEELADTLLCLYSIAQKVGVGQDELVEMLHRKAAKWQSIQTGESALKSTTRIPFELHITVAPTRSPDWNWDKSGLSYQRFVEFCASIGVKFTVLYLYGFDAGKQDWMTSSTFVGTVEEVDRERERIVHALNRWKTENDLPFEVVREKIETVPWHPAAPSIRGVIQHMPKGCYFEKHWEIPVAIGDLEQFSEFARRNGLAASRNLRKTVLNDTALLSLTHRQTSTREYFEIETTQIEAILDRGGYRVADSITEFAIYDTDVARDADWITTRKAA